MHYSSEERWGQEEKSPKEKLDQVKNEASRRKWNLKRGRKNTSTSVSSLCASHDSSLWMKNTIAGSGTNVGTL